MRLYNKILNFSAKGKMVFTFMNLFILFSMLIDSNDWTVLKWQVVKSGQACPAGDGSEPGVTIVAYVN